MAQHDYVIDNSTGANVRSDINSVLQAIASNNSGSSAPSTTIALQFYADTTNNILKLRNAANDGFINLFTLAGGVDVDAASNFNEDVTFTGATSGRNIVFDKSSNALRANDNATIKFGTDGDADIFHDGSDLFIREIDSGQILFRSDGQQVFTNQAGSEIRLLTQNNGKVALYFDHTERLQTTSTGVTIIGDLFFDNPDHAGKDLHFDSSLKQLKFEDGVAAKFGTGNDLSIYHSGVHSFISDSGTGNLRVQTNNLRVENAAGTENQLLATENDAIELYYDNTKRLETFASGAKWTGQFQGPVAGDSIQWTGSSSNAFLLAMSDGNDLPANSSTNMNFHHWNGTAWKKSYEFGRDALLLPDNIKLRCGTSSDLSIFHNGTKSFLENITGDLIAKTANSIFLEPTSGESGVDVITNGGVLLYFDNANRFETESTGALLNGKYRQKSSGGNIVYAQQVFRESIAANATKTFTITGLAYGNVKLTMGFGDGNFHYAAFAAVLGGNMFSSGNAYQAAQLLNDRSGVNSITVTKSNTSYAVAIHAGTNQIFGSVIVESNGFDSHSGVTLTIS